MAGKGLFKMKRQMGKESEALSAAGSKQSLWSKVGMGLGGLVAMGLTGGAATPLVAAMMAGGGTLAGGLLGRQGAKKGWFGTDKAKMKGGRFYRDEAAKWKGEIGSEIWSGAAKAGLTAGMAKLGSGLSYGKEGLKATIPGKSVSVGAGGIKTTGEGFKMGDIVKRGTETATYSDSLMGKLGKAIDIKGSVGYKLGGSLKSGITDLAGDVSTGFKNKSMDWSTLPEGMSPRDYQALVGERQASYAASEAASGLDFSTLSSGPSAYDIANPADVGEGAISSIDQGLIGPSESTPFDRSSMLRRQKTAIMQGKADSTPFSGGPGIDETSMSFEDWQSADPSSVADTITPSEFRRSPVDYNLEKIDVPKIGSRFTKQGLKSGLEDFFAPGGTYKSTDILSYPSDYAQGPPELLGSEMVKHAAPRGYDFSSVAGKKHRDTLDSIRWQNRLFGE